MDKPKKKSRLTVEEQLEILRLRTEEKMHYKDIAKQVGRSYATVENVVKKEAEIIELAKKGGLFKGDLKNFSIQDAVAVSLKASVRLLEQALTDAEKGYEIVDERRRRVPLKTLMDCIEKAVKALVQMENKKKSNNNSINIDYKEMAKLYVDAKKDKQHYDSEQHMKDLLNLSSGKIKEQE